MQHLPEEALKLLKAQVMLAISSSSDDEDEVNDCSLKFWKRKPTVKIRIFVFQNINDVLHLTVNFSHLML